MIGRPMRYLRMLTNAFAGGVLIALYLGVLVLQLNPQVSIASNTALGWFGALLAMYGPYVTVLVALAILGGEALAARALRPGWLSVRILAWLSAATSSAAAMLTWANLESMRSMLSAEAARRMSEGATATTICATVLAAVAILRFSVGRRGNRPGSSPARRPAVLRSNRTQPVAPHRRHDPGRGTRPRRLRHRCLRRQRRLPAPRRHRPGDRCPRPSGPLAWLVWSAKQLHGPALCGIGTGDRQGRAGELHATFEGTAELRAARAESGERHHLAPCEPDTILILDGHGREHPEGLTGEGSGLEPGDLARSRGVDGQAHIPREEGSGVVEVEPQLAYRLIGEPIGVVGRRFADHEEQGAIGQEPEDHRPLPDPAVEARG